MEQAKHGGDHSSRAAQLQARENEQKALSLWLKGATFEQVAAAGFGIATANGAWRAVHRALARIPKEDADQAREAQLARLQALRLLLWNHAGADPIKAAEALIKLEAREARLLGLDMPTKVAVTDPDGNGIPLETVRRIMERMDNAEAVDITRNRHCCRSTVRDGKKLSLIQPSRPERSAHQRQRARYGPDADPIAWGPPVLRKNVGTEWAVRPRSVRIRDSFRAPPV